MPVQRGRFRVDPSLSTGAREGQPAAGRIDNARAPHRPKAREGDQEALDLSFSLSSLAPPFSPSLPLSLLPSFLFLCSPLPLSSFPVSLSPLFPLAYESDQEGHLLFLVASHRAQVCPLSSEEGPSPR